MGTDDRQHPLADVKRWLTWRFVNGQKRPQHNWGDRANLLTFDDALTRAKESKGKLAGIGIAFAWDEDKRVGVDLDHVCCKSDPGGTLLPEAREILEALCSYTELSPSHTGTHTWVTADDLPSYFTPDQPTDDNPWPRRKRKASLPVAANVKCACEDKPCNVDKDGNEYTPNVEVFVSKCFMTVTAAPFPRPDLSTTIDERAGAVEDICARFFVNGSDAITTPNEEPVVATSSIPDDDVLDAALLLDRQTYHRTFVAGEVRPRQSPSESDLALACLFARLTQDVDQIERLMRRSALRRDKWAKHKAYLRDLTIGSALKSTRHNRVDPSTLLTRGNRDMPLIRSMDERIAAGMRPRTIESVADFATWRGKFTVLAGDGGVGKSTLLTTIALSAAERGHRVLAVSGEETWEEWDERLRLSLNNDEPQFDCVSMIMFNEEEFYDWDEITRAVDRFEPTVLLLDSLSGLVIPLEGQRPDDSEGEKWHDMLNRRIKVPYCNQRDVATVLTHHATKNGDMYRGSTGINSATDFTLVYRRVDRRDDTRELFVHKRRHPLPDSRWFIRLRDGDRGRALETDDPAGPSRSLEELLLRAVRAEPGLSKTKLEAKIGGEVATTRQVRDAIKRFIEEGKIRVEVKNDGHHHYITDNGERELEVGYRIEAADEV
jgi:energy-coupling factor transporter ATP-binding protein EcfA2